LATERRGARRSGSDRAAGLPMISTAANRRLGWWLVGLFLCAQVLGVMPLMSEHTAHVAQTELAFASDHSGAGHNSGPGHHHRGDADGAVQHHQMQDLSGAFMCGVGPCEIALLRVRVARQEPGGLVEADPILLERPPKTSLSV
jgi:hypothetical protein